MTADKIFEHHFQYFWGLFQKYNSFSCQWNILNEYNNIVINSFNNANKEYDYYFSSTLPIEAKIHFPFAPEECKIKIALYTKRPNRVDIEMDGTFVPATNADVSGFSTMAKIRTLTPQKKV